MLQHQTAAQDSNFLPDREEVIGTGSTLVSLEEELQE